MKNALTEIRLRFTGLQRNKALWDYYESNSEVFGLSEILEIKRELSRYRYVHEYSDILVSDSIFSLHFSKEKEKLTPMKAFEILFYISDGLKRNELLIDYVYSYPGVFSQKEKKAISDFIYYSNDESEFGYENAKEKIVERL